MRRVMMRFAGREVEFVDRDVALRQLDELAEGGTWWPLVVYGPEGCGKTALLRQAFELLSEREYDVVYVNPLEEEARRLVVTEGLRDIVKRTWREVLGKAVHPAAPALVELAMAVVSRALRRGRGRIALLADEVFQAVGVDRAELLVKAMLNVIEHPPQSYDKAVVVVASSEGVTRARIGRHRWSEIRVMWNMPRDGLQKLHDLLPGEKPSFEEAWRWTGGNPEALERLYRARWHVDVVVDNIIENKEVTAAFVRRWRAHLPRSLEDPDYLWEEPDAEGLAKDLVEKNLVIPLKGRRPDAWIDVPPPERDPELGIGKYYAWQTPIHREAVKRALRQ